MIISGAVPAPLPAHLGVSQISQIATSQDFADPLGVSTPLTRRTIRVKITSSTVIPCTVMPV